MNESIKEILGRIDEVYPKLHEILLQQVAVDTYLSAGLFLLLLIGGVYLIFRIHNADSLDQPNVMFFTIITVMIFGFPLMLCLNNAIGGWVNPEYQAIQLLLR